MHVVSFLCIKYQLKYLKIVTSDPRLKDILYSSMLSVKIPLFNINHSNFLVFLQDWYGSTHLPGGGADMEMTTAIAMIMDCYMLCDSSEY